MGKLFYILQWTPFPAKFQILPGWQLQAAEFDLMLNKKYYYEHATCAPEGLAYESKIARRIVRYWKKRYPFAQYKLKPANQEAECQT